MAAVSSACAVLPAQDVNAACSSGRSTDCYNTRAGRRRIVAPVRIKLAPVKRGLVQRRALRADAVLVTENWQDDVSHSSSGAGAAEEALALSLAAAKAARDAAALATTAEFPSEFDLLRLERARLTDMEHSFRADYDAESAALEAEQSYVLKLESLLGGVSSLVDEGTREADADERREVDVKVKSKRRAERMRRRERALEKAEKVASALASAPPFPKPKKVAYTHDSSDPIRTYLRDIGRTRLLTGSEEVSLSRKIQDLLELERVKTELKREVGREPTISEWSRAVGMEQNAFEERLKDGRHAKDKMVNSNLRLVVSIAKKYQNRGMILQDLIQEGSLGLIRGAEKFDPNRGYKFSTYAHWWIRQAITRAIADQSRTIRLPIHLYEVISRINKAKKMLVQEHGRTPRDEEVAELVGLSVEKMQIIVKSARAPSSMERTIGEDENTTIGGTGCGQGRGVARGRDSEAADEARRGRRSEHVEPQREGGAETAVRAGRRSGQDAGGDRDHLQGDAGEDTADRGQSHAQTTPAEQKQRPARLSGCANRRLNNQRCKRESVRFDSALTTRFVIYVCQHNDTKERNSS